MSLLKIPCAVCKEHQHDTARHVGVGAELKDALPFLHSLSRLQNNRNPIFLQSIKQKLLGIFVQRQCDI